MPAAPTMADRYKARTLGIKKPARTRPDGYRSDSNIATIGGQKFPYPSNMHKKFAKKAAAQGWSRPIDDEMLAKAKKREGYLNALAGWSVGEELTGERRCKRCAAMKDGEGRPFKECVIVDGYWNGACANCSWQTPCWSCSFYDGTKGEIPEKQMGGGRKTGVPARRGRGAAPAMRPVAPMR